MAHFGMQPEHKQILKKNRLCLLEGMNPEPVLQRLYQQNMMSQVVLESIQALPTRYKKNAALVNYLPKRGPKVFQLFCRALSASGQYHIRSKIQPEGDKWCVGLMTVITFDGKTLSVHKGRRSVTVTLKQWNKLTCYIPAIQENLDLNKDAKLTLGGDLHAITTKFQDFMCVGLHRYDGEEIIPGSGFNMNMEEWTEFLTVMETITEEVNESHPRPHEFNLYQLINFCYIYILMRDIKARTFNNCHGCEQDCPGQSDHIPGCLSEWGEMVERYFTEAVLSFSRPLFAEICR